VNTDARIAISLPSHPKTKKLIRRGGQASAWNLVCLFLWVSQNKPSGDLTGMSDEDIEIAANWEGEEGGFIKLLSEVRFLDGGQGSYVVHDWEDHNPWAAGAERRTEKSRAAARARWGINEAQPKDATGTMDEVPADAPSMPPACHPHANGNAQSGNGQCPVSDSVSVSVTDTQPIPEKKPARKRACVSLPPGFAISERVRAWAQEKGHTRLDEHLENFLSYVRRKAPTYADWDEALMQAIRKNWAGIDNAPTDDSDEVVAARVMAKIEAEDRERAARRMHESH
jgi:hypothetical protein